MKRLSGELVELKQHLEHYDKIQELTQMLQESHRCRRRPPAPEQRGPSCCSLLGAGGSVPPGGLHVAPSVVLDCSPGTWRSHLTPWPSFRDETCGEMG